MGQIDLAVESLRASLTQLGEFLPKLMLVVIILVVGWLVAKALRFIIVRGLKAINFNVLTDRAGIDGFLRRGGIKNDTCGMLGLLSYWLVILATLMIAFNSFGLTVVTDLVGQVLLFIPQVIVAVLILALGAYFARFVENTITAYLRNIGVENADLLGRVARYAILVFVVLIALDQMNVAGDIIRLSLLILLVGVALALALAFGLGSQKSVAQLLERWRSGKTGANKEHD